MKILPKFIALGIILGSTSGIVTAASVTMQIIVDNDYAIFVGTTTSVTRLIHQNDFPWNQQYANSPAPFSLVPGEDTIYILAMGAGGSEQVGAIVNGSNLTTLGSLQKGSSLLPFLSGYPGGAANGTYSASLSEIQTAMSSPLSFGSPGVSVPGLDMVFASSFGSGFQVHSFESNNAFLYQFSAEDVGASVSSAIPEPSTFLGLTGLLSGALFFRRRER